MTIIVICLFHEMKVAPCFIKIQSFGGETQVTFPGCKHGQWHMDVDPHSLSAIPTRSKGMQNKLIYIHPDIIKMYLYCM